MSLHEAVMSKHSNDLVVGECKDGPTWGGSHLRLDYWVLRRSWSKPAMIGYEVKSSRADFLKDQKWQSYLPLCNELWFIADPRHILPGELPDAVGHLRLAGSRLITVRRAAWREIEPPTTLMTYILMCRTSIKGEHIEKRDDTERWREWLAEKEEKRKLGYNVSKALREKYEREVEQVRRDNDDLRSRIDSADKLAAALLAKGIDWRTWTTANEVEERLSMPKWDRHTIESAHKALGELLNGKVT